MNENNKETKAKQVLDAIVLLKDKESKKSSKDASIKEGVDLEGIVNKLSRKKFKKQ